MIRNGLQNMVKICDQFANLFSMKFSTNNVVEKSKTKCIIFTKYPIDTVNILPIYLNDVPLPYIDNVKHLGCHRYFLINLLKSVQRYY